MSRAFATSPLRLLTPRNHGHAAWIFTSSHGGGLVDGDDIALQASVGAGATAFLSTQSATKVYRSPRGTRAALDADIGDNALLVVAPDAVICFAGSRYRQTQRVNLGAGSGLVLLDWVTSGRRESGERWAFDEYVSRTVVHLEGRLVVHDALALRASDGRMDARFGPFDVLAAAVLVGRGLAEEVERLDARVRAEPVKRRRRPSHRRRTAWRRRLRPADRGPHRGRRRRHAAGPSRLCAPVARRQPVGAEMVAPCI